MSLETTSGGQGVNIGLRPYLKGEPCVEPCVESCVTEDWSPTAVFISCMDRAGCSAPLNLSYFPRRDFFFEDHFSKASSLGSVTQ